MARRPFPVYSTHQAAALRGCFQCCAPLDPATAVDKGYPPRHGQYGMKCPKCGATTFYDVPPQLDGCNCAVCLDCAERTVCATCFRCTRHAAHAEGCVGCPAGVPA